MFLGFESWVLKLALKDMSYNQACFFVEIRNMRRSCRRESCPCGSIGEDRQVNARDNPARCRAGFWENPSKPFPGLEIRRHIAVGHNTARVISYWRG
jgi:hypothetical protein